jgi:4,5-dihydroxyphthalate decarboxylase
MSTPPPLKLHALIGDYPVTAALKSGAVRSPHVALDFADVKPVSAAFKRTVRDLEFDVSELAIVTYLLARAHGKPLTLLPAVLVGRFQHPLLVYNAERGALDPGDLAGKRVGVRSYSVTTGAWIRGILADDYGIQPEQIRWLTFEEAHVAEFRDPPNVVRAPAGAKLVDLLLAGELDAAIVGDGPPSDPRIRTLLPDPAAAARAWHAKHGAIQVNHLVVVKDSLARAHPDAVREIYRLLVESKRAAGLPRPGELDLNPFGVEANRRNLEVAIDCCHRQGLIPRAYAVDELFDATTRTLGND